MIVCVCHRVSDRDIERAVRNGCDSFEALQDDLRVATGCGRCGECARDTFDVARACHGAPTAGTAICVVPITAVPAPTGRHVPAALVDLAG